LGGSVSSGDSSAASASPAPRLRSNSLEMTEGATGVADVGAYSTATGRMSIEMLMKQRREADAAEVEDPDEDGLEME
jgi:hypothetical protein